jgi:RNA polymerase sigma factor for flagellar operon FliA
MVMNVTRGVERSEEQRILDYYPLARTIAWKTWRRLPPGADLDELVGAAVVGLIEAVQRFEPARGVEFTTFAKHRIRGAVLDALRAADWVPRSVRRRAETLDAIRRRLREGGAEASHEAMAKVLEVSAARAERLVRDSEVRALLSLDALGAEVEADAVDEDPEAAMCRGQSSRAVRAAVERLPERERVAVQSFYLSEMPLRDVGDMLGVTESRVSQLCKQAMARMKVSLSADEP